MTLSGKYERVFTPSELPSDPVAAFLSATHTTTVPERLQSTDSTLEFLGALPSESVKNSLRFLLTEEAMGALFDASKRSIFNLLWVFTLQRCTDRMFVAQIIRTANGSCR